MCKLPISLDVLASFPGLLIPTFVACSTVLVLQVTNAGVRRPGNEVIKILGLTSAGPKTDLVIV